MKKRILVCGGRRYFDIAAMDEIMDECKKYFSPDFCIIHGGARGADTLAGDWAFRNGHPTIVMRANWTFYGNSAGPIRNEWMLKYAMPDLVISFAGGTGTADMVSRAKLIGVDTHET